MSCFILNECNCCTSHTVYFHDIVLPFLMSVNCVDHCVNVTSWSLMCGCLYQYMFVSKALFNWIMFSYLHRTIWMWRSQRPCFCGDLLARFFDGRLFSDQFVLWLLPVNISETFEQWQPLQKKKAAGQTRTPSLDAVLWNRWHLKCISSTVAELITLQKCCHWAPLPSPIPTDKCILFYFK